MEEKKYWYPLPVRRGRGKEDLIGGMTY